MFRLWRGSKIDGKSELKRNKIYRTITGSPHKPRQMPVKIEKKRKEKKRTNGTLDVCVIKEQIKSHTHTHQSSHWDRSVWHCGWVWFYSSLVWSLLQYYLRNIRSHGLLYWDTTRRPCQSLSSPHFQSLWHFGYHNPSTLFPFIPGAGWLQCHLLPSAEKHTLGNSKKGTTTQSSAMFIIARCLDRYVMIHSKAWWCHLWFVGAS